MSLPDRPPVESAGSPGRRGPSGRSVLTAGMLLATIGLFVRAAPYVGHQRMFSHDNLPLVSYLKLFYGNLMAGRLPLWTPELNAGQPLWPVAEIALGLDPIAVLAWLAAMAGGGSAIDVLHWTCLGWLLTFAAGAVVLARRATDDPFVLIGIYAFLVLGPIWLTMPTQAYGFLLPFRYLPWVLWLSVRLIERPTRLRGLGLGLVGGLSLAGYQAVYTVPVIAAFVTTYLLARIVLGLRPGRAHTWSALSAGLAFLPVAFPTGVALAYASTDMYVVARTHYPGRYVFPASAFLLDLMAPLTPSPRSWHGAFSLGPGPLFLLLLGAAALLSWRARDWNLRSPGALSTERHREALGPERVALNLAWLVTTAVAILLAIGPATDRLLLGLRNWGFVLTVALLGATQLTAAAAEAVRRRLDTAEAPRRRALSLAAALVGIGAVVALGFYATTRVSIDVARECALRLVCDLHGNLTGSYVTEFGPGLALFLAVLMLGAVARPGWLGGGRRAMVLCRGVFLGLVLWHLIVTLGGGPLGGQALAIPVAGRAAPPAPGLDMKEPALAIGRERLFDIRPYVPFHYEGPAVWHRAAARTLPVAFAYGPLSHPVTPITHVLRFWRYQVLVSAGLSPAIVDRVLSVEASPLRLASRVFPAEDLRQALELLARPDVTEAGAVVVEATSSELAPFVRSSHDDAPDSPGTVEVEHFSGARVSLRVHATRPALLVYSDGYDPEWSASVDGKPVPVYPANLIGKTIPVPAGDSRVELAYRPWLYIVGFWMRALTLLIGAGAVVGLSLRRVRR